MVQTECTHTKKEERCFTGTWVVDKVKKAVEIGYKVLDVYEIWQYKTLQYDKNEPNKKGLFASYIDAFFMIKLYASGYPDDCLTEEDKNKYIEDYFEVEKVKLDKNKIVKNPGLRSVAKLCLNSFWGKFGQRNNLTKTKVIDSRDKLLELLRNPKKEIISILLVNDDVLYTSYKNRTEDIDISTNTNVVIVAYTTAQARLKLYSYLE